jgi:uncharacterized protein
MLRGLIILCLAFAVTTAHASNPSFNCRYAKAPDEVAVCQDEELGSLDRRMAYLYSMNSKGEYRSQRDWLRRRRACGYNADCIREAYLDRIGVLEYWDSCRRHPADTNCRPVYDDWK